MNVTPDFKLLAQIREEFEGFYPSAYKDTGNVWTIGYGSTYNFNKSRKIQKDDFIDRVTALAWMRIEDENIVKQANYYIKQPLNVAQSTAVVDYIYNRGIKNFLKTNLDELINANPMDAKIKAEFIGTGLWDRLGNKWWGLGRRRRCEAHLYFTGEIKFNWPKWS